MGLDFYQAELDARNNAETAVLDNAFEAAETAFLLDSEGYAEGERPYIGSLVSSIDNLRAATRALSETTKDVLYGLSVGALVGATTVVLFLLLTL